jgi:hypothetical protein
MSTSRTRRIGRREAEKLLSGAPIVSADRETLIRLLNLAGAPPRPEEQVGREFAMQAFIRARREEGAHPAETRRGNPLSLITRALVVKALAGVTVLLLGGVALAAGTGNLPAPVQRGAHDLLSPLGVAVPDGKSPSPSGRHNRTPAPGLAPAPDPDGNPSAMPVPPRIQQLCQEWQASLRAGVGKSMDPGSLRKLAEAAGGPEKITSYCAAVLAQPSPSDPGHGPNKSAKPKPGTPVPTPTPTPSHPGKKGEPHPTRQH